MKLEKCEDTTCAVYRQCQRSRELAERAQELGQIIAVAHRGGNREVEELARAELRCCGLEGEGLLEEAVVISMVTMGGEATGEC